MAFYPLKVKDDQGNTHVVGDPRILNGGDKAASIEPVPTVWGTVTVSGDVLTTGNNTQNNYDNGLRMSRFIGRRVRITFPSCVFTALVAKVAIVSTWNVSLTLLDIVVESGSYPSDGDVSVAGTTWLEDVGEFKVVLDSEPSFSGSVYGTSGKSMYFEPVEEVIGQITGPSTAVSIPQPVASDWAGAQWLTTWSGGWWYGDYVIVAQWTGPSDTVTKPPRLFGGGTHTFEFTIPGGDTVTFTAPEANIWQLEGTWDPTAANGGFTGAAYNISGTWQNGAWYALGFYSFIVNNVANLDTNLPPSWTPTPSGTTQDITSFTITQPDKSMYAYPTTISNPRTTYLNHPLYGLTVGTSERMALRFAGRDKHELYLAYLGPSTGFTDESGTSLLGVSSTEIYGASSESYPIDIVALAPGESTGIAFRGSSGNLQGIRYDKTQEAITNYSGKAFATDRAALSNLEVLGEGSPFARVDMATFSSTLVATNTYNPINPNYPIPELYETKFKLNAAGAEAFLTTQYSNPQFGYPVLYELTSRAVVYDWWRHNSRRGDTQFEVNAAWVPSASYDAATQMFTLYTDHDLTPASSSNRIPERNTYYNGLWLRIMGTDSAGAPNTTGPTPSTYSSGLSTGTFRIDGVGGPGARGNLLTSIGSQGGNLAWRPTPGLVTKRYQYGDSELAISNLERDAYSDVALGGADGFGSRIRVMKLMVNVNNAYQSFSSNHDLFMRFNPSSPVTARYATKSLDGSTGTESSYSTSGSGGASYVNLGRAAAGSADDGAYHGDLVVTMSFRPQGTKFEATWLPGGVITNPKYTTSGTTAWTSDPANGGLEFFIAPTNSGTRKLFTWDVKTVIELHAEF